MCESGCMAQTVSVLPPAMASVRSPLSAIAIVRTNMCSGRRSFFFPPSACLCLRRRDGRASADPPSGGGKRGMPKRGACCATRRASPDAPLSAKVVARPNSTRRFRVGRRSPNRHRPIYRRTQPRLQTFRLDHFGKSHLRQTRPNPCSFRLSQCTSTVATVAPS